MTESEFIDYWNQEYPEALPIGHELKWIYTERWFRIHSLPESKRYAESADDFKIILNRQNQLIEDLIGGESDIAISSGFTPTTIEMTAIKSWLTLKNFEKY